MNKTNFWKFLDLRTLLVLPLFLVASLAWAAEPAAEVVLVTGGVTASTAGSVRSLSTGDFVYPGDAISVGQNSYANLKFSDGGRILLRPGTEFTVEAFKFTPPGESSQQAAGGQAFFRLVKGGFRAISGLIGKVDRQSYRVSTPIATIGIRGTDYDVLLCEGDCPTENLPKGVGAGDHLMVASRETGSRLDVAQNGGGAPNSGLIVGVNEGGVGVTTPQGTFNVDVNQFVLALSNGQVFVLPVEPLNLMVNPTPDPGKCE